MKNWILVMRVPAVTLGVTGMAELLLINLGRQLRR